ncbi:MAG TPA: hypothetical protein VGB13_12560, partial [Candidatus Krumholzibacteria bacterium]
MLSCRSLILAGSLAFGCGSGFIAHPVPPTVPYGDSVARASADFVEKPNSPFIVHWEPSQAAALEAALRQPGRVAVVRYDRTGVRLLTGCELPGVYAPTALSPYQGTTEIAEQGRIGVDVGAGAEAHVTQEVVAKFEYVISGKWAASRAVARHSELAGACSEATHFVSGAFTGAYERLSAAAGDAAAQARLLGFAAGASGGSHERRGVSGGRLASCASPAIPEAHPNCSALVRLELEPIQPAVIASVELVSARSMDDKPSGSDWDANSSAPDVTLHFRATTGGRLRFALRPDVWTWNGSFPVGDFEVSENLAIEVQGEDRDFIEDDPMGTLTLSPHELATAGELRRSLRRNGSDTVEL